MPATPDIFHGLSAFPPTPVDEAGIVDLGTLGMLVDRLAEAGVGSIGLLGSTGIYAYLEQEERKRAVAAAVEAAAGRVPLIVGVGALRTDWAVELAVDAERAGADGLLLAPMSYTPLTQAEVATHFASVARSTGLPLSIYNNPSTTGFTFHEELIGQLSGMPGIAAVKMPFPADGDVGGELERLGKATPEGFAIGYSGDWGGAASLLAGAAAWYSVVAGLLPAPTLRLAQSARHGDEMVTRRLDAAFEPLWRLFRSHGSLRIVYALAPLLGLRIGSPPPPLLALDLSVSRELEEAIADIRAIA